MEQQEARKPIDWLKFVFVTENLLIFLVLAVLGMRGCVAFIYSIPCQLTPLYSDSFHEMHIHSYPDKLIYVIGQDTELDLTGGQVCFSVYRRDLCGFPCEAWPVDVKEDVDPTRQPCISIQDMAEYAPNVENIVWRMPDLYFTKPGVYNVVLQTDDSLKCSFPIQVVERQPVK